MSDRGKVVIIILLLLYPLFSKAQDLYDQALQEYRNGRIERAKEILNKKLQKNSGDYNLLGWILLRLMELQKAEEAFKKSLDIPDSYCGLGYVFYQSGDTSKALSYFEEGLKRDPTNRDCLEGIALLEKRSAPQKHERHEFFALGDYFWIKEKEKEPRPLFIKGIDIGFGMPGRFPSEFPEGETLYREWFELISEMGVNVIRVYTILPPEFYTTLKRHNTEKTHKRLFLIQGIWVELPEDSDFRSPEGLNHGGLTEEEQAEGLKKLFLSIKESGCAGGIIFSWIDEWWKANWMTKKYEENDQLWYNAEDPEENYGIMAVIPSKTDKRLRGEPSAWPDSLRLYCPEEKIIKCLSADSDEGYLYIKVDLSRPIDWSQEAILIGIDTFGDKEGDHLLPFNLKTTSPVGLEYIILLHGINSKILVDNNYAKSVFDPQLARLPGLTGYRERTEIKPSFNNDGNFIDIITVHRRRFSRDGKIFPERLYNASILKEGNDFYYSRENNFIELKIPWGLLNFSDPSQKKVIYGSASVQTEGIRFLIFSYKTQDIHNPIARESPDSKDIERIIRLMRENPYRWNGWTQPLFTMRPKKAYYVMTDIFKKTPDPALKTHLPEGFDFEGVSTKEEHDEVYSWLQEDRTHRALLFHSAPYEDGYRLFFEFPEQTSFGDIKIYTE